MERSDEGSWTTIRRHILASGEAPLAPLVVVSGTHGWGKTTWMRQYEDYVHENAGLKPQWVLSRVQLEAALCDPPGGEPRAIFADMLTPTANDPLWDLVLRFVENNPQSIVVTSCVDRISPENIARCRAREVWEKTLAFSFDELQEVVALNAPNLGSREFAVLRERLRGNPYLVRRHLERLRPGSSPERLTRPDSPTERLLIRKYEAWGPLYQRDSYYLRLLLQGAGFRRFDLSMLPPVTDVSQDTMSAQFERLELSPLGRYEVDPHSGRDTFEWSVPSWLALQPEFPERASESSRLEAFRRTADSGATALALFYLLDLGRYAEAEDYVDRNLRLFLLHTPEVVESQLFSLPPAILDHHPNLAILTGELLMRVGRGNALVRRAFQAALTELKHRVDADVRERFRTLVREAFCRVSLGDRAGANQRLDNLLDLVGTDDDPGPVLVAALENAPLAQSIADELYLPFWTATQLDRHRDALRLAGLMRTWVRADSPTTVANVLTAVAEEVFAGLPPIYPDAVPDEMGHTDALQLLGQGRGKEALALVLDIDSHRGSSRTRSAAEALVLTVRALEEPATLTLQQIDETVERSRDFWSDGRPSTFVAQAASLAYLALRRPDLARAVLAEFEEKDWFLATAGVIEGLVSGAGGSTLISDTHDMPDIPRAEVVAEVLTAASFAALGQERAARMRLSTLWMRYPDSLVRYALRLVPKEVFDTIYGYRDSLPEGLAKVLEQAAGDPHVLVSSRVPSLSRSEMETLELLRGASTYAEVAEARFVSINTVRAQVKALYRKLEVTSREDAIAKAETLGLLK